MNVDKLNLISLINWDYNYTEDELLALIEDKTNLSNMRICFFIKSLETFTWQEMVYLWGLDECDKLYTDKVRKGIFSKTIREEYDGLFYLLRNKTLSHARRSSEEFEKFRASLLFNRRNRSKQRIL